MPLTKENQCEYHYNKKPKCPHCDNDIHIDADYNWGLDFLYKEGPHETFCTSREKEITITSHAIWRFSTNENLES